MKNILLIFLLFITADSIAQDSSAYFYKKGVEEKTARRYLVASKHFDRATQLNPKFTAAYLENAFTNLEMRKMDAAKMQFSKVIELDPGNQTATKELVNLYYSYKQYQQAIDLAKQCKNCDLQRIIAMSYYKMEDYGTAEKLLLAELAKRPGDPEAYYILGRSYLEMELEPKAIPYYVTAVTMDPEKSAWLNELGLLYYNANDFKNAVIYFNKAAEKGFTKSNDFTENLGYSYIYSGDFEKGEKILLDLQARKPGSKDIFRDLADAYYKRKMYDKSLEFCQKLMEMDMKDGKALYQAGLCFQKKGQKDRGQQMCDKAIELDPSLAGLRSKKGDFGGMGL